MTPASLGPPVPGHAVLGHLPNVIESSEAQKLARSLLWIVAIGHGIGGVALQQAGVHDAVLLRLGVVIVMVVLLGFSYFDHRFPAQAQQVLVLTLWLLTAHLFWLVYASNMAPPHVVSCLALLGGVSGIAPFAFSGPRTLLGYLATVIVVAAIIGGARGGDVFFVLAVGSIAAVIYVAAHTRWSHQRELDQAAQADQAMRATLRHADKLAALGSLVAGVAHEITNPLTFVLFNLEELEQEFSKDASKTERDEAEVRRSLVAMRDGIERVRNIVGELRAHSRHGSDERAPVHLSEVVRSAINMLGVALAHRGEVIEDLNAVRPVLGSASRITQVVVNLLQNAQQALPLDGKGHIWIRSYEDNGFGVLEVSDDGPGVTPELRERIFEPFFTTKPVDVGTGLGLFVSHRIVTDHGGAISLVAPRGKKGATFQIRLPLASAEDMPAPQRGPAPESAQEAVGRLLLVEDDAAVGAALQRLFRRHTVDLCNNGIDALHRLREHQYDIIICDVMMPGMGGRELWNALRTEQPGTEAAIVFLTGGAFTAEAQRFLDEVPNRTFLKPIDGPELRDYVARRLQRARQGLNPAETP